MAEGKEAPRRVRTAHETLRVIGFRLPAKLAEAVKMEAARRNLPLNALLAEMWELYKVSKRAT